MKRILQKVGSAARPRAPRFWKRENKIGWQLFRSAASPDRPACPECRRNGRHGVLLAVAGSPQLRRCSDPVCEAAFTLDELAQQHARKLHLTAAFRVDHYRRQALIMFMIASGLVSAAALFSAYRGSVAMFVGALILSVPLFMTVFAARYRAWQAATGRYYEVRAPFGDFVRDEIAGWRA